MTKLNETRFLRLISAQQDMKYALAAYEHFKASGDARERHNFALAMIVSYGRPFTRGDGLGRLQEDNPAFPDYSDQEMNSRHHRLMEIRHRFLAHSTKAGILVHVIPPNVPNPNTGTVVDSWSLNVAKREFLREEYVDWLKALVDDLNSRLKADIKRMMPAIGPQLCPDSKVATLGATDEFTWEYPSTKPPPAP